VNDTFEFVGGVSI